MFCLAADKRQETNLSGKGSREDAITTPSTSRTAKAHASEKMKNSGKGCNKLDAEDGKFNGVSYVQRGKTKKS